MINSDREYARYIDELENRRKNVGDGPDEFIPMMGDEVDNIVRMSRNMQASYGAMLQNTKEIQEKYQKIQAQNIHLEYKNSELQQELNKAQQKYRDDNRTKMEKKASLFVGETVISLNKTERVLLISTWIWAGIGAIALTCGLLWFIDSFWDSLRLALSNTASWKMLIVGALRSTLIAAFFFALTRYAFLISQREMDEYKKVNEKIHTMRFGQLYLEAVGADAEWDDMKDAFQHTLKVGAGDGLLNKKNTAE